MAEARKSKPRKKSRPRKKREPIEVVVVKPELCRFCSAQDSLITYKTKDSTTFISRYRRCKQCGKSYNYITDRT